MPTSKNPPAVGTILAEFTDPEECMTVCVVQGAKGLFHVSMRDDDLGQTVGYVRILPSLDEALTQAHKWAGI